MVSWVNLVFHSQKMITQEGGEIKDTKNDELGRLVVLRVCESLLLLEVAELLQAGRDLLGLRGTCMQAPQFGHCVLTERAR